VFGKGPRQANPPTRHLLSNQATAERASETAVGYTRMMPKIFEQDGYSFFFYSNDMLPSTSMFVGAGVKRCSLSNRK